MRARDAIIERFERWCDAFGIVVDRGIVGIECVSKSAADEDALDDVDDVTGCFRVVAKTRIDARTTLAVIPKAAVFTTATSRLRRDVGDGVLDALGEVGVVCAVAYERQFVEDGSSAFSAYFAMIPQRENLPQFWWVDEDDARRKVLRGTSVEILLEEDVARMESDWMEAVETLNASSWLTFDAFRDAASVVASRAFFVDEQLGQGLMPFADLFNHLSDGAHFHVVGASTKTKTKTNAEEDAIRLESCREIPAGDEVYNSFGDDHDNAMLLYKYGFAERTNVVRSIQFPDDFWNASNPSTATDFHAIACFYEWLNENYGGIEFEIDEDGGLSRGLLTALCMASKDDDEWLEYEPEADDSSSEEDEEAKTEEQQLKEGRFRSCVSECMDEEATSTSELLAEIKPELLFTLFAERFQYYCGDEISSAGPSELLVSMLDDVRACLASSESSPGSFAVGGGVCGLSAAYLLRAQELSLLSAALVRACFDDDDDDQEASDDETCDDDNNVNDAHARKKPKVLVAAPAYNPTVYLHKPSA